MSHNFGSVFCNSSANKAKLLAKLKEAIGQPDSKTACVFLDEDEELQKRYELLHSDLKNDLRSKHHLPANLAADLVVSDIVQRLEALNLACNFTFLHTRDGNQLTLNNSGKYAESFAASAPVASSGAATGASGASVPAVDVDALLMQIKSNKLKAAEKATNAQTNAGNVSGANATAANQAAKDAKSYAGSSEEAETRGQQFYDAIKAGTVSEDVKSYYTARLQQYDKITQYCVEKINEELLNIERLASPPDADSDAALAQLQVYIADLYKDSIELETKANELLQVLSDADKSVVDDSGLTGGAQHEGQLFRRSGLLQPGMDLFGSKVLAKCGRYLAGPEQVQNGSPAARGHYAALYAVPTVAPGLSASTLWVNKMDCNPESGNKDLCVWVPANVMEQAFFKTKEFFKCQLRKRKLQLIDLARQIVAAHRDCGPPAPSSSSSSSSSSSMSRVDQMDHLIQSAVRSVMQRRGAYGIQVDDHGCTDSDDDDDDSMFLSLGRKEDHYLHKPCRKQKGGGNKYFNTDDMVSSISVVSDDKPFKSSKKSSRKSKGSKKSK